MKQLGKIQINAVAHSMKTLDEFEEEIAKVMAMETKTQVDVFEELIVSQDEEEEMAGILIMVTIILIISWEGIIILSIQMKNVVYMEDIHGVNLYTT